MSEEKREEKAISRRRHLGAVGGLAAAAPGGGYILSTCSAVTDACKPENFATQIGVGRSLGRYPKHA